MKELQTLAAGDATTENRDYWKNQLKNAIDEIRRMYEEKMETMKEELETHYSHKVQEFKTGAVRANIESTKTKEDSVKMRTDVHDMREKLGEMNNRVCMTISVFMNLFG